MLRRQDSVLSSSSQRETSLVENQKPKSIGCVSSLFRLLSKYQNRRKSITFGKKNENYLSEEPTTKAKTTLSADNQATHKVAAAIIINGRLSCEVPRSPTLPADIRRSKSVNSSENYKASNSPSLVARLMGLDEMKIRTQNFKGLNSGLMPYESVTKKMNSNSIELASEKRRKLLGALEKCNEDLKMLTKVIARARFEENPKSSPTVEAKFNNERGRSDLLLDEFNRSPLISYLEKRTEGKTMPQQRHQKSMLTKKPGENDVVDLSFLDKIRGEAFECKCKSAASSTLWSSKAMVESINEVCKDIDWGQKREIGKIGLVLQDYICRDLIEEIAMELGCFTLYTLPFEACKRRLHF